MLKYLAIGLSIYFTTVLNVIASLQIAVAFGFGYGIAAAIGLGLLARLAIIKLFDIKDSLDKLGEDRDQ